MAEQDEIVIIELSDSLRSVYGIRSGKFGVQRGVGMGLSSRLRAVRDCGVDRRGPRRCFVSRRSQRTKSLLTKMDWTEGITNLLALARSGCHFAKGGSFLDGRQLIVTGNHVAGSVEQLLDAGTP